MIGRPRAVLGSVGDWIGVIVEIIILVSGVLYVATNELWALLLWEAVALGYLVIGFIVLWPGKREQAPARSDARRVVRWMWIPPLLSAVVGAQAAITALAARNAADNDGMATVLMIAASAGIVLAWSLLQLGFAEAYQVIDALADAPALEFPGRSAPTRLDYIYFSFTLGTSFATSDVEILAFRMRRVVLVHTVVAFFYNAVVIAVAIQVVQSLLTQS